MMQRRKFIKKGSLAVFAVSSPLLVKAAGEKKLESTESKRSYFCFKRNMANNGFIELELGFNIDLNQNNFATHKDKEVSFDMSWWISNNELKELNAY
jgi:hypothetical protein